MKRPRPFPLWIVCQKGFRWSWYAAFCIEQTKAIEGNTLELLNKGLKELSEELFEETE